MNNINYIWLTLNRACNLRCKWCYAKGTNFAYEKKMDMQLAKSLIDFSKDLNVKEISLIGGEPTCYAELNELIAYIHSKGLASWLITNGLNFENKSYLNDLIHSGLDGINFSLKGWSKESYINNTGMDVYKNILQALKNLCESKIDYKISFVISADNIDYLLTVVDVAKSCGAKEFFFSFENDFSILDGNKNQYNLDNISKVVEGFTRVYNELNSVTNGDFVLHQSYPLCVWDSNFIKQLSDNNQIITTCALINRTGLFFDVDGSLIPCNAMHQISLGKFKTDFSDLDSFDLFWNSEKNSAFYNALCSLPSTACSTCSKSAICGGGCISNWYNYSYNDLIHSHIIKN